MSSQGGPICTNPTHDQLVQWHLGQVMLTCNTQQITDSNISPTKEENSHYAFVKLPNLKQFSHEMENSLTKVYGSKSRYQSNFSCFYQQANHSMPKGINGLFRPVSSWSFNTWNAGAPRCTFMTALI